MVIYHALLAHPRYVREVLAGRFPNPLCPLPDTITADICP